MTGEGRATIRQLGTEPESRAVIAAGDTRRAQRHAHLVGHKAPLHQQRRLLGEQRDVLVVLQLRAVVHRRQIDDRLGALHPRARRVDHQVRGARPLARGGAAAEAVAARVGVPVLPVVDELRPQVPTGEPRRDLLVGHVEVVHAGPAAHVRPDPVDQPQRRHALQQLTAQPVPVPVVRRRKGDRAEQGSDGLVAVDVATEGQREWCRLRRGGGHPLNQPGVDLVLVGGQRAPHHVPGQLGPHRVLHDVLLDLHPVHLEARLGPVHGRHPVRGLVNSRGAVGLGLHEADPRIHWCIDVGRGHCAACAPSAAQHEP